MESSHQVPSENILEKREERWGWRIGWEGNERGKEDGCTRGSCTCEVGEVGRRQEEGQTEKCSGGGERGGGETSRGVSGL